MRGSVRPERSAPGAESKSQDLRVTVKRRGIRGLARVAFVLALGAVTWAGTARAAAEQDRFSAGGYFRIMTRPGLQGGNGQLGYSDLYGRLLNEGPYGHLELNLNVLQNDTRPDAPWAQVHVRLEGGSFGDADPNMGNLSQFRVSQMYVRAGNVLLDHVTWRLGTQWEYPGDIGLYDQRPAELFYDTLGLSADYQKGKLELLLVVGDAGYGILGPQYSTILTGGGWLRLHFSKGFEAGVGGQFRYEPEVKGDQYAPYSTPGLTYDAYIRGEVAKDFLEAHPGQEDLFPRPEATSSNSWKLVGYVGFGGFGPIQWDNFYVNFAKQQPKSFTTETYQGRKYTIYIKSLTDQRYQLNALNQLDFTVLPGKLDGAWAMWFNYSLDKDNTIAPSDDNQWFFSTVLRMKYYLTRTVHLLVAGSAAHEHSLNGNRYRDHLDSIFQNTSGVPDDRGLEMGDSPNRNTYQLKAGVTLNPTGLGIFARPEIRLLYGLQYSTQQAAYGNGFVNDLQQYNYFLGAERHWHSVIAIEAEGWF